MDTMPYQILLVDDDLFVLTGIGKELESDGFIVLKAESGERALEFINEKKSAIDIIITDLVMGGINGIEVLKKSKEVSPDTMVMILTGFGEMHSAIQALQLGADDFMLKPGTPEERSFRIKKIIDKLQLRQQLKLYEKILPVCCVCKQIRDDSGQGHGEGEWMTVEEYMVTKGKVQVTSTYCPICFEKQMAEMNDE